MISSGYEACGRRRLKDQSSQLQPYEKNDIFGKIMKNGAFFVFTACSESL
jgi:hypothetical protein